MSAPTISFVIPCFKLAHLLSECVNSILSQTYKDCEILIMDDCSPDDTPRVARSFGDSRVRHIRNEVNLGHLANYNKGISLSRGKYIWLISADDYLSVPYVVEKYVSLFEKHPRIGYIFCPGIAVGGGANSHIKGWVSYSRSIHGGKDRVISGHRLLQKLLLQNSIVAASGAVRRECYEKMGAFPLNMPWAGDWYLWCLFALKFDVGYLAEPMVCYRDHELSMTKKLWKEDVAACCEDDIAIPWAIKEKADEAGCEKVAKSCLSAIAQIYARGLATIRYGMSKPSITFEEFEESLSKKNLKEKQLHWIRARVYAAVGNEYYSQGDRTTAAKFYSDSLRLNPWMISVSVKRLLLSLGKTGEFMWSLMRKAAHARV